MVAEPFDPELQLTLVCDETETVKVGEMFTVTLSVFVHPLASVPVTV